MTRLRRFTALTIICCLAGLIAAGAASAAESIYWANYEAPSISRANLSGGGETALQIASTALESPYGGLAVDSATGKIYWPNEGGTSIGYSNLDGSGAGLLNTAGATVARPSGVAVDPATGRIYWVNEAGGIYFANLDGSGGGVLNTTGGSFSQAFGLAIYPAAGRLYWANYGSSTIGYANLDGSGAGELAVTGTPPAGPVGLAVDSSTGKIYWANYDASTIGYANLDGSGAALLNTGEAPIEKPDGVAIDTYTGKIYWTNEEAKALGSASLDGSGGTSLNVGGARRGDSAPVLLKSPKAATPTTIAGAATTGSTLTCTPSTWAGDLVESNLYQAPQSTSVDWTLNGVLVAGASGTTLTATAPGSYACQTIAVNGAGRTTFTSRSISVVAPTPAPVPVVTPATVRLTKVKLDKKNGTATILAKVSGPGTLSLKGKKVVRRSVKSSGAGIAKLKVVSKGGALKALERTGKAKVKVTVTFVATEGARAQAKRVLTLRSRLHP